MLGVVLDVQVVAGVLRRHVTAGARLAVVVVDGALHRHLRRGGGGVDAGVVVCWQLPSHIQQRETDGALLEAPSLHGERLMRGGLEWFCKLEKVSPVCVLSAPDLRSESWLAALLTPSTHHPAQSAADLHQSHC